MTTEGQPGRPRSALRQARGSGSEGRFARAGGPARRHSWMEPGQEPGRASPPPRGSQRLRLGRPLPTFPRLLSPASSRRHAKVRGARWQALGAGVWSGVLALRPPPLQPLRALWPPPAPAASFHKSPGVQPVPAFQAGPTPAAAVPKHEASSPNPPPPPCGPERGGESRRKAGEGGGGCQLSAGTCGSPGSRSLR